MSLKSLPIPDVEEEKVEEDTNLRWTVMNKQKPHLYIIDPYDLNSSPESWVHCLLWTDTVVNHEYCMHLM